MAKHKFISPNSSSFRTRLGNTKIQCVNGVYETDDDNIAEQLKELIKTNQSLGQHIQYANMAEADALVAQHMQANEAVKGGAHGGVLDEMKKSAMSGSGNAASEMAPNNDEALAEVADAMSSEIASDAVLLTEANPLKTDAIQSVPEQPASTDALEAAALEESPVVDTGEAKPFTL